MTMLLAVNDGLTNGNWNEADICFLIGLILGALSAIAYAAGVGTVAKPEKGPDQPDEATTTTPVGGPAGSVVQPGYRQQSSWTLATWHYRAHELAAALLALAVASVAFGLFLQ